MANTFLVENLEGVYLQDLLLQVSRQETGNVVAAITESHLRKVVRSKAEIFGSLSDVFGNQGCTWHLNHGSNVEVNLHTFFFEEFLSSVADNLFLLVELVNNTNERYHDFGMWVVSFLLQLDGSTKNGARLHGRDFGIGVTQTATAVSQHGVMFA